MPPIKSKKVEKLPPFSAKEAEKLGLSRVMLPQYLSAGLIERISRGIYQGKKFVFTGELRFEELAAMASQIKYGAITLISALYFYNLTDEFMREFWLAIPNHKGKLSREGVRFIRYRNMSLGLEEISYGGLRFKIFNRERTIVDCFRYLDFELSIKALKEYMRKSDIHRPNFDKLLDYAEQLRTPIEPYVKALLV